MKKGFTVAEILITIALITIVSGPLITSFMVGLKSTELMEKDFNMDTLAQELMQEVLEKDFEDKNFYGNIGKEEGELTRKDFNDIDDYDGYIEDYGNISDVTGIVNNEYANYKRYVEIYNGEQKRITPEDGLKFEYFPNDKLGFNVSDIVLSRDGNRIFGINRNNSRLFAANPFSGDIEDEIEIDELPINIEISTDSKKLYLNYGYRIDIYSYTPGTLSLTSIVKGMDFGKINDVGIFNGKLVIASDRGIFSDGDKLNLLEDIKFVYFKFDKSVIQSGNKILVYDKSQLKIPIGEKIINDGKKVSSAFYDEYNERFIFSTKEDYIYLYNIKTNVWSSVVNNKTENLNSVFYSWTEGELYAAGDLSNSKGLFKSVFGNFAKIDLIDANDHKIYDMDYSEEDGNIYFLTNNLYKYSIKNEIIDKIWESNIAANPLRIIDRNEYIYMLYDTMFVRYDKSNYSVLYYEGENFIDFCIDNSHVYLTDSNRVIKLNLDFSEPETLKFFTDIEKLIMSKDGKTLFMSSPSTDTVYFLDTFTNKINSVSTKCNSLIQSASGNTLISTSGNEINLIKNTVIETKNLSSSYKSLINIDKTDQFLAYNQSDRKLDVYEYVDKFADDFDFFSGYNFYAYFNSGSKGFNIREGNSQVTIDTASAWDSDNGINTGKVLIYRTFVFPIPKYLKNINLDMKYSFSGEKLEFFAYAGFLNKDKIESTAGTLFDADVLREIPQGSEFSGEFTIPPTNIITVGFIITDISQSTFAEFMLDKLTLSYNKDNDFTLLSSYDIPWNKIDCYALSWDNKFLYVGEGNTLHTFDLELAKNIERKSVTISECSNIESISVSVDNNTIFAATDNGLYSIKEPIREKIIKVMVESNTRNVPPFVIYSTASNWKTTHSTRVIPHILNREFIFAASEYGGFINKNTVWFPDKQYVVDSNILIKNGASLLLLPGVNVKFKKDAKIIVEEDGKFVARKSVFTSINDHFRGAVYPEGSGIPQSSDYAGIDFQDDSEGIFDGCEFYYSSNAITKSIDAKLKFENSIISNCDYGIKASGKYELVAGDYIYNTTIKSNKFFDNNYDIYVKNFEGEIKSNYFVRNAIHSIYFGESPFLRIINNSFILKTDNNQCISGIDGEITLSNNEFILTKSGIKLSNTKIKASDNIIVSSSDFITFGDNKDGKDIILLKNKFIDSKDLFNFTNLFNNNTLKAYLNYFIGCSSEINNDSGLFLNFKYNYWDGNPPAIFTNVQNNPYLLYGLISDSRKFEDADIVIHNFVRILSQGKLELINVRPYFFSEQILPFIDIMKNYGSYGSLSIKNSDFSQKITPAIKDISDVGITLNPNWKGLRILGKIDAYNTYFDNVNTLFNLYNTDETNHFGADLSEIVYCETGNNTERIMNFKRVTNNANSFNLKAGTVSFNIFRTTDSLVSSAIEVDSAMAVPAAENKLKLPYNFWNDNYFSEDMLSDFSAYVDILPNAVSGKVDGDLSIDNVRNPVVAIGDIELYGSIIFSADTPEILFATDSGLVQKSGKIYKTDDSQITISDIRELDADYSKYRYFDYWGDADEISSKILIDKLDFSDSTDEIKLGEIEDIYSASFSQTTGKLKIKNSNIIASNFMPNSGFYGKVDIESCNFIIHSDTNIKNTGFFGIKKSRIGFYDDTILQFSAITDIDISENSINGDGLRELDNLVLNEPYSGAYGRFQITGTSDFIFKSNKVRALQNMVFNCNNSVNYTTLVYSDNTIVSSGSDNLFTVISSINEVNILDNKIGTLDIDFTNPDIYIKAKEIFTVSAKKLTVSQNLFQHGGTDFDYLISSSGHDITYIKGNIFKYKNNGAIFTFRATYYEAKSEIFQNVFINDSMNPVYLIHAVAGGTIDFSFNHNIGKHYFYSNHSAFISIWNNNFEKLYSNDFIETPVDFGGNYFSDNSANPGFRLNYPVDISKTPDFLINMDVNSLLGSTVFQQGYLTSDKNVKVFLKYRNIESKYDFGNYTSLFYNPGQPNSIGMKIVRKVNPAQGKYYINYLPYYVNTQKDSAVLDLNNSLDNTEYIGDFFVNHSSTDPVDNFIKGDWSDDLLMTIPSSGLIGGGSQYVLPLPAEPNSLPVEPDPPIDFKVVSVKAPYYPSSMDKTYDFDGNVEILWENNRTTVRPIYFYRIFLYNQAKIPVNSEPFMEEIVTSNTLPYINHVYSGIDPGFYTTGIRAFNANANFTENSPTNPIPIGDEGPPHFDIVVHAPPVIEGPLAVDMDPDSGNLSGSNIVISPREGANRYYYQISKNPDFSNLVREQVVTSNVIPLSSLSFDNGGVYYIRAKAGYSDGTVTEYTEFGEWNPLFVKRGKLLATVINLDTITGSDYESCIKDMILPVHAIKSGNATNKVSHVLLLDTNSNSISFEGQDKIKVEAIKNYLLNENLSDVTYISTKYDGMYNKEILDGIALSSTYKISNAFVSLIQSYDGGLFYSDMPGRESSSISSSLNNKFGVSTNGPTSLSGNQTIYYKSNTLSNNNDFNKSVVSTGIVELSDWETNFLYSNIWKFPTGSSVVHCADSNIPLIIQFENPRKIFLNFKIHSDSYNAPYYSQPNGKFEISMIEIADRSIRFVLGIQSDPPLPIKFEYRDLAGKGNETIYKKISVDGVEVLNVYDIDGNLFKEMLNGRIFPNLSWNLDKNVTQYSIKINTEFPFNLEYTDYFDFTGMRPVFNSNLPTSITYQLIAENDWGATETKTLKINFSGNPEFTIPNSVAGGSQTLKFTIADNNERADRFIFHINKVGDAATKYQFPRTGLQTILPNYTEFTDISNKIGHYQYRGKAVNNTIYSDTNNNQEVSNEINGIFSIKPPGMNFVLPPYNVWSPHELYEDF
ncbi:MAG: right-handed parallel beta-helix repeat-containing protein, partial [Candidatus Muirbacterium halophilum]|nr:right-handed parallel beta-helix repeat-containing protein [Candidatus Muirbacterium halophilum]